jgi:hypothetical protein
VYLASEAAQSITGRVFIISGGTVSVAEGWDRGPTAQREGRWDAAELVEIVPGLVEKAAPNRPMSA